MWYRVVAVNEDIRPLAGVDVEAIDLTDRTISAVVTTNRSGEALFTGLTGPHFFRPRVRRTSTRVGGRTYTGQVKVQIVGFSTFCIDFVVDADGGGSHATLAGTSGAFAAALAATGSFVTIWLCNSETVSSPIEVGGLNKTILIKGWKADGYGTNVLPERAARAVLTGPAGDDLFQMSSAVSGLSRGLMFDNIGFNVASGFGIIQIETGTELAFVSFENCYIGDDCYCVSSDGVNQISGLTLIVKNCWGNASGFYDTAGLGFGVDVMKAEDNDMSLVRWWNGAMADQTYVQGGRYTINTSVDLSSGSPQDRILFDGLSILYTAATAMFTTGAASSQIRDVQLSNMYVRFTADGRFCNLGSAAINNNEILLIHGILGFGIPGDVAKTGTFITIDTDYLNVRVVDIHAPQWATLYSGPLAVGDDHGLLSGLGDDDHTQYLRLAGRAGGQTAIGGTAAGEDLTLQSTSNATRGSIIAVDELRLMNDANFLIDLDGTEPRVLFDHAGGSVDDYRYQRTTNLHEFRVAGGQVATISGQAGATQPGFVVRAGGATVTTALGVDNLRMGVEAGVPKLVWEDATFDQWRLENAAGVFSLITSGAAGGRLDLISAGQLQLPITGSAAGLRIGGDVDFYRSAANEGTIPDNLVLGQVYIAPGLTGSSIPVSAAMVVDRRATALNVRYRGTTGNERYRSDFTMDNTTGLIINAYDDTGGVYLPIIFDFGTNWLLRQGTGAVTRLRVMETGGVRAPDWLRVGADADPVNVTDGDLTLERLRVLGGRPDDAFSASGRIVRVTGTITDNATGSYAAAFFADSHEPTVNFVGSNEIRALYFQQIIAPATGITTNLFRGGYFENRWRSDATGVELTGLFTVGAVIDSSSPVTPGTITRAVGLDVYGYFRASGTGTITIGDVYGIRVGATNVNGLTVTNTLTQILVSDPTTAPVSLPLLIGVDVASLTRGTANIGIRNASPTVYTPSAIQTLAAASAILANASVVQINSVGNVLLTSTPTIANGQDGQILVIINVDTVDTITLQDETNLAGTNLRLSAATIGLGPRDTITLTYNSSLGDWIQIAQVNNL